MKRLIGLGAALIGLTCVTTADAGHKAFQQPVLVTNTAAARIAYGQVGDARASSDTVGYIGCGVRATATAKTLTCSARSATNVNALCSSTDPNLISVFSAVTSYSTIAFEWDTATPTPNCTMLDVGNYSHYRPMTP